MKLLCGKILALIKTHADFGNILLNIPGIDSDSVILKHQTLRFGIILNGNLRRIRISHGI